MDELLPGEITRTRFCSEIFFLITVVCLIQAVLNGIIIWNLDTKRLFDVEKENLTQLLNVVNQYIESRIESIDSIALDIVISSEI